MSPALLVDSTSAISAPEKHSNVYAYPIPNTELIKQLGLQRHPEGGYFAETDREEKEIPSPYADGKLRPLSTTIYYLLTYEEPSGVFHMNKSVTMHVHHQGRAEYTLIYPEQPPRVEIVIVGPNLENGETLQLLVGSNVWKKSRLLEDDVAAAGALSILVPVLPIRYQSHANHLHYPFSRRRAANARADIDRDPSKRAHTGCLITEVVFPGFHWEDHRYLRREELKALWGGESGWEVWAPYVKADVV
ncbi:hypothetical protein EIP86_011169 [Pleurotus ostreatoroseus]|nr:hypothetical protein EIP86_011169 [Pleurotus ostreatoroseus]